MSGDFLLPECTLNFTHPPPLRPPPPPPMFTPYGETWEHSTDSVLYHLPDDSKGGCTGTHTPTEHPVVYFASRRLLGHVTYTLKSFAVNNQLKIHFRCFSNSFAYYK